VSWLGNYFRNDPGSLRSQNEKTQWSVWSEHPVIVYNFIIHNFIRHMTAQIKLVKTKNKQTNKQNVNKVHRTIKSYNYYQ